MSTEANPRPWRVKRSPIGSNTWIVSGEVFVASVSRAVDAALIVDAVNERDELKADNLALANGVIENRDRARRLMDERDRLRELVKRLIPAVEESFAIAKHEAESIKGFCALNNVDSSEVDAVLSQWENLLREAAVAAWNRRAGEEETEEK